MNNQVITTKNEIKSWYLYDLANSVFATPSLSMFVPILLDTLSTHYACTFTECDLDGHPTNQEKLYMNYIKITVTLTFLNIYQLEQSNHTLEHYLYN